MRASLAVFTSAALLAVAGSAAASPTFPPAIKTHLSLSYEPPCAICHEGGRGGSGTVTTAFGRAMMDRGLKAGDTGAIATALDKIAADKVDSDGDGTSDIDALKSGKNPNGASGIAIGAPPVEYGCGGATVARTHDDGTVYLGLALFGAVLVARRRRFSALVPLAVGAAAIFASCNPYEVSFVAPEVCQSGKLWTGGESESERMNPGMACIDCHRKEGPRFTVAGTLYGSSDEKDRCGGTNENGAAVYIQGSDGKVQKLVPNDMGNFYSKLSVAAPYKAWVQTADGKKNAMVAQQSIGDCNTCHTQKGENGAPGRIVLPPP